MSSRRRSWLPGRRGSRPRRWARPRPWRRRRQSRRLRMGWRDAAPTWSKGCAGRSSWPPATPTSPPTPPAARAAWWPCCSRNAPRRWPRSPAAASLALRSARLTPGIRRYSCGPSRVTRPYLRWKPSWRGPPPARFPATWLGYAHAVTLAAAGDATAAEAAFGKAERAARRYPLFRAIALRLAAEAALDHPFGDPVRWLREAEAVFVSRRLPRIDSACRGLLARAGAPATRRARPRRRRARTGPAPLGRHGPGGRSP